MKKPIGIKLGDSFRLTEDRKVARDEKKIEAKLDICTKLKRRKSRKIRVRPVQDFRV